MHVETDASWTEHGMQLATDTALDSAVSSWDTSHEGSWQSAEGPPDDALSFDPGALNDQALFLSDDDWVFSMGGVLQETTQVPDHSRISLRLVDPAELPASGALVPGGAPQPIPEPATGLFLVVGAALLGLRRRP
jgi:hypothetical protein